MPRRVGAVDILEILNVIRKAAAAMRPLVPRTLSSYGDRTFAAAGPRLWNSLPVQLRNPDITYGLFRRQVKGRLFREA